MISFVLFFLFILEQESGSYLDELTKAEKFLVFTLCLSYEDKLEKIIILILLKTKILLIFILYALNIYSFSIEKFIYRYNIEIN